MFIMSAARATAICGDYMQNYLTIRRIVFDYLISGFATTARGINGRFVQNQDDENGHTVWGLYDKNGDYKGETTDTQYALDWLGIVNKYDI